MSRVFPEEIIYNVSQLKFTAYGETGKSLFNFSLIKEKDKFSIESLPPGVLPDKMVINLTEINSDIRNLIEILRTYQNKFDSSEFTDLGNDIDYAIKELPKFLSRLKIIINDAAAKMTNDIFGNVYSGFGRYKYVELLFSQDYKNIISVRLLGRSRRRTPRRFVMFNIPNENLDINIVNLVYRSKNLIKQYTSLLEWSSRTGSDESSVFEFVSNNFVPVPPIHKKPYWLPGPFGSSAAFIEELTKNVSPKTYDTLIATTKNFNALSTKQQVFQASQGINEFKTFQNSSLLKAVQDRDRIKGIKDGLTNPLDCILFLWNNVFSNLLSCEFLVDAAKTLASLAVSQSELDDQLFRNISLIQLFEGIDRLPPFIRQLVYLNFANEKIGLNIDNALIKVQEYISSLPQPKRRLTCNETTNILEKYYSDFQNYKSTAGLSDIFRQLKQDYPDNFTDIQRVFDDNFSRDAIAFIVKSFADLLMAIDYCNFNLNFDLRLPNLRILDLWGDFSFNIQNAILGIICEFLSDIFEMFVNMLMNIGRLDEFFSKFMNDEDVDLWVEYVDYAFYLLITSSRASTETQRISNSANIASLQSSDGQSFLRSKVASTISPNPISVESRRSSLSSTGQRISSNESNIFSGTSSEIQLNSSDDGVINSSNFCKDDSIGSTVAATSQDISYEIPFTTPSDSLSLNAGVQISSIPQTQQANQATTLQNQGLNAARLSQTSQPTPPEVLDKIKFFGYCKKYDFFTSSGFVDPSVVEILRQISKTVPPLYSSDINLNVNTPNDKNQLSESLKKMFRQIQSVLSTRELSDLITGNYTEEVASVVRIIAKINFPNLTNNLDPIKYFTMLGKVVGRNLEDVKKSGAIR